MKAFVMNPMPKVYFGNGALKQALENELSKVGPCVMVAYGGGSIKKNGIYDEVMALLEKAGKRVVEFNGIMANPTYAKVQEGAKLAREKQVDFILAVGGGSVIDCCKVVSAQAKMNEDLWEATFVNHHLPEQFIPLGAVTTASGTGSEMNNGAVITNETTHQKNGMVGALSRFVVLDPAYTLTVPMAQVISGAFDTFSHAMETYFGRPCEDNVSDDINEAIMRNTIRNIWKVIANPQDEQARSELMWDSAMAENGLLKLGKVTDFQAHMIEHQLGAYTNCNHGQGLAVIQPRLYRHLYKDNQTKFKKYALDVWQIDAAGLDDEAIALAGIEALEKFISDIGLPRTLTEMGITDRNMLRKVADSTIVTAGCARQLDADEIYTILLECL